MRDYLSLLFAFFRIGAFTFGGGYAMISLIDREVVQRKKWLTEDEFIDIISIVQILPGPIALNLALFVGNKKRGFCGSMFAALGMILPSFIIILLIASIFSEYRDMPAVEKILKGVRPAVVALISVTVFNMVSKMRITKISLSLLIATILLISLLGISPIYLILTVLLAVVVYNIRFNSIIKNRE